MTPSPQRPSGRFSSPSVRTPPVATYEIVRIRVLSKLAEKLDPAKLKRMPASFMQQEVRRHVEQLVESDGARLTKAERDLLIEDLYRETVGYGPLEELFADANIREVLVLNHQTVLSRRKDSKDEQGWMPTNVRFRDAEHLKQMVGKAAAQAEPVIGEKQPSSAIDGKLPNGFRVLALLPPAILDLPPYVLFLRNEAQGKNFSQKSGTIAAAALSRASAPTPPSSAVTATPAPRSELDPALEAITRLRTRITEHIVARLASLGVYDTNRFDIRELQKAVSAYVREFCDSETIPLSHENETRLVQEILILLRPPV